MCEWRTSFTRDPAQEKCSRGEELEKDIAYGLGCGTYVYTHGGERMLAYKRILREYKRFFVSVGREDMCRSSKACRRADIHPAPRGRRRESTLRGFGPCINFALATYTHIIIIGWRRMHGISRRRIRVQLKRGLVVEVQTMKATKMLRECALRGVEDGSWARHTPSALRYRPVRKGISEKGGKCSRHDVGEE